MPAWRGMQMDTATQVDVIKRLRSVEGHIRGVRQMVVDERPCIDIIRQMQAVQGSVRQISLLLITQHVDVCVQNACGGANDEAFQQMRKELKVLFSQKV
jgi:DNA-binding FrmR family transcriptional regulator